MQKEKSCGAVVYRRKKGIIEYLVLKSIEPGSYWGFPKGHVELGESEQETCIREVLEETGIYMLIEDGFRIVDSYMIGEDVHKEVVFFLGNMGDHKVKIQAEEIEEFQWNSFEEALELLTFQSARDILKRANEFLLK